MNTLVLVSPRKYISGYEDMSIEAQQTIFDRKADLGFANITGKQFSMYMLCHLFYSPGPTCKNQ